MLPILRFPQQFVNILCKVFTTDFLVEIEKVSDLGNLCDPRFLNKEDVTGRAWFGSMLNNSHWLEAPKGMVANESSSHKYAMLVDCSIANITQVG